MANIGGGFGGMMGKPNAGKDHKRLGIARQHQEEGNQFCRRGNYIAADDTYGKAIDLLEAPTWDGTTKSQSGEPEEDQLLAQCLSSRAQCVLDMAEGKGILPDGTPFASQFDDPAHFDYFKRQATKQAEECAEKACKLFADDQSLFRLGLARMMSAKQGDGPDDWLRGDDHIDTMKDAGRQFLKSIKANPTEIAQKHLEEARKWLADRKVTTLYPEYV